MLVTRYKTGTEITKSMLRGNRTRERKIQPAAVLLDGSLNTIKLNILLVKLDDARVTLCRNAAIRRCYTNLTVARARENPTRLGTLPYPTHG